MVNFQYELKQPTRHQCVLCIHAWSASIIYALHSLLPTSQHASIHHRDNMRWHEKYIFHVKCIFSHTVGQRRTECLQSPTTLNTDATRPPHSAGLIMLSLNSHRRYIFNVGRCMETGPQSLSCIIEQWAHDEVQGDEMDLVWEVGATGRTSGWQMSVERVSLIVFVTCHLLR